MHDHVYIARAPLDVYPLARMTPETEPGQWTAYTPATNGTREYWTVARDVRLHLPGVRFLTSGSPGWHTEPGLITLRPGWQWDGASGPAIDDPSALLAAACHDVACTRIEGPDGDTHPLPSYLGRHCLYARILRAQGEPLVRCLWSWVGLMVANWYVDWRQ